MPAERLLPRIEPHERRRVALAATASVCIASGALLSRTAGDSLFLARFGAGLLPFLYVAGSLASAAGAAACIRASRRFATGQIAMLVAGLLVAANAGLFAALHAFPSASRIGAYLLADITVRIPVFLFWAFTSEIFDPGESRRLFGVIGAAGTAACLPAGLLAGPLARRFGTETLVLPTAVLMAGFALAAGALFRNERRRGAAAETLAAARPSSARRLRGQRPFLALAALAVVTTLVETLVDFQFKATAASTASSSSLASLFGLVYGVASVASLLVQLVVVHRLLPKAGVFGSLCVLPGGLFLSLAGVLRFGTAGWAFATKALDITLATTINGAARQLLYRGILRESRLTARALIEGLYQPLAAGLAGAGLVVASGAVSVRAAVAAAFAGCLLWLVLAWRAHAAFVSGLLDALRARRFGSSEESLVSREPAVEAWLREAISSAPDEDLIHLATLLPQLARMVDSGQLRQALARENPRVKIALLQSLQENRLEEADALARPWQKHQNPDVRRCAILAAWDAPTTRDGLERLEEALGDPEPRVRAVAAAGLASATDPEARRRGQTGLQEMIDSEAASERFAVAEALEHAGPGSAIHRKAWIRLLVRLLMDEDESVILAALETLRSRPDSALALPVIWLLSRPTLAGAASDALVAMGEGVVDSLVFFLDEGGPGREAALARIPEVLDRIGDPRALAAVKRLPIPATPEERAPVFRAWAQLLRGVRLAPHEEAEIDSLVLSECRAAAVRLQSLKRLGTDPGSQLVRSAVSDVYDSHVKNAFTLVAGRALDVDMEVLHSRVTREQGEARFQTLELLHNVLPPSVREPLLDVLEARDGAPDAAPRPADEIPALLLDRDSEWIVAGAAWAVAELPLPTSRAALERLREHGSPLVRETALVALERLGSAA